MEERPFGVVGGGIVGLAIAREVTRRYPGREVVVFEKEAELATHQTGHNSGVVHAGIYYKPGRLKAELCTRGRHLLKDFSAEHDIEYNECGKLVTAIDESEMERLDALESSATENGVPGLRRVDAKAIKEIEPHAAGIAALHSPATAIIDYGAIARAYASAVEKAGGRIVLNARVTGIDRTGSGITVTTPNETVEVDKLVICAGLQADRVGRNGAEAPKARIVPFRGEYMDIKPEKRDLVRGLIYPVPDPRYPFLGVHFTRRVNGVVDIGPNAVLGLDREGYGRLSARSKDIRDIATWPGFWRMASQHWKTGAKEVYGSLSVKAFMKGASRYVPEIGVDDVERGTVGVRAQAVDRDGSLVDDFRIEDEDGIVSVRNAPSPAATSSLAIAEYVLDAIERD
ncbi:MAG: L-2-hydroxyglutarate oxidase [Ilumatobacter sp.]